MISIFGLIEEIRRRKDCIVMPSNGFPELSENHVLPKSVVDFYSVCGGMVLFSGSEYPLTFVSPNRFLPANPIIIGEQVDSDITSSWYVMAEGRSGEYVSIDAEPSRAGRCYDSYIDRHGVKGDCPVIADSLEYFIGMSLSKSGGRYYWLLDDFVSFGDAYD